MNVQKLVVELDSEQNKLQTTLVERQQLETQLQESKIVKSEFSELADGARVYKKVGPVLLPQDKTEAKTNVDKRLEFISKQIEATDARMKELQSSVQAKQAALQQAQARPGN